MNIKLYLLMLTCIITKNVFADAHCWGYPGPRKLKPQTIEKLTTCPCECRNYPKTKGTNNFYVCINCSHRHLPDNVLKKHRTKSKKSKRAQS